MYIDKHVPHKTIRSNKSLPWINHQIKKDIKTQKGLYNTAKMNNTQHDWDAYKRWNVKLKKAHSNYYARLFDTSFDGKQETILKVDKS